MELRINRVRINRARPVPGFSLYLSNNMTKGKSPMCWQYEPGNRSGIEPGFHKFCLIVFFQVFYLCVCMRRFGTGPSENFDKMHDSPPPGNPGCAPGWSVADPCFPRGGRHHQPIIWHNIWRKLNENWTETGGVRCPPQSANEGIYIGTVADTKAGWRRPRQMTFLLTECMLKMMYNKVFYYLTKIWPIAILCQFGRESNR